MLLSDIFFALMAREMIMARDSKATDFIRIEFSLLMRPLQFG